MNTAPDSGTQLSFLSDARSGRPSSVTPRMATNVLQRMLTHATKVSPQGAIYFKAIFPAVMKAAEHSQGLPVTKTTLRPQLADPVAAITLNPPVRNDEVAQIETLLDFVQHRLASAAEKLRLIDDMEQLLEAATPELLVTPDNVASQLYAPDRSEASQIFSPLLGTQASEAAEALIEAYVLLRANNADVQSGIAKLFWHQNTGSDSAEHYIEGCADGQARAYFRRLLSLPESHQRQLFSLIDLETFYATLGSGEIR